MAADSEQGGSRLDPRIKGELDKLNSTSEEINRLEKEVDNARRQFRGTLTESSFRLSEAAKRCGKSVKKAKPFHESREKARKAHENVQEAAYSYRRAVWMFQAAKETINIAEDTSMQGKKKRDFDSALQEMLNHATVKLNAAEHDKVQGQKQHRQLSKAYVKSQAKVEQLSKKLRKSIAKSASYYDLRDAFYSRLENLKESVENRQKLLAKCKKRYREALHNLEHISEDIHRSRQSQTADASPKLQERSSGVGAESEIEPARNTDDEDEVFTSTPASKDDKAKDEHKARAKSDIQVSSSGAEGRTPRLSSSYSSSPEDNEVPQSPLVLTEHGLPTLSKRFGMKREGSDPDFYRPKVALAKLPGLLPEDQEVIEATYRGYRPFDAELTAEEVKELGQLSLQGGTADAQVVVIESSEAVNDAQEGSEEDEDELEIYEPEEIEMSELANEGSLGSTDGEDLGLEDANTTKMTTFEQETQLNGDSELNSSQHKSIKAEIEEADQDLSNSGAQEPEHKSEVINNETTQGENAERGEKAERDENNRVNDRPRMRSMSFGFEQTIRDDEFEKPTIISPVKKFSVCDLQRPSSAALFQYHATNREEVDVHRADVQSVFTFQPKKASNGSATNGNQEQNGDNSA